jgi:hypothetical protein
VFIAVAFRDQEPAELPVGDIHSANRVEVLQVSLVPWAAMRHAGGPIRATITRALQV